MSVNTSVTTEQTIEVAVDPAIVSRLSAVLAYYQEIKLERDLLDEAIDIEKAKMLAVLTENGIEKVSVDNTGLSVVRGYSSSLDKVKFVQLGGSLKQLENATTKKPKRPYILIGEDKSEHAA